MCLHSYTLTIYFLFDLNLLKYVLCDANWDDASFTSLMINKTFYNNQESDSFILQMYDNEMHNYMI